MPYRRSLRRKDYWFFYKNLLKKLIILIIFYLALTTLKEKLSEQGYRVFVVPETAS